MSSDIERKEAHQPSLVQAIETGGIHYHVAGTTRDDVLRAVVGRMRLPEGVDLDALLKALIAREELGSTAIGCGIAIPHVRNPIVPHLSKPLVALCFLETPLEYGALDKKPVHTMFPLISPTIRCHIQMLSRLSFGLREPALQDLLVRRAPSEEILAELRRIENGIRTP
jgi:nitrogen PTS system EIIA component